MKIVYSNYGSPDVLKFEEIAKPILGNDDVLIKVRAAFVRKLMEAGGVAPVIDRFYSLSEVPGYPVLGARTRSKKDSHNFVFKWLLVVEQSIL